MDHKFDSAASNKSKGGGRKGDAVARIYRGKLDSNGKQ